MRLPKGFGKNYFTLRAITATSAQVSLNANASRVENFHILKVQSDEQEREIEEEDLAATLLQSVKPCHCNCYYFKRTKRTLLLCKFQKLIPEYFKNLNNNISPPSIDF
jgi:ribosomal protein L36